MGIAGPGNPDWARGLDVSQWQGGGFPFGQVAAAGYSFVFLRASVGLKRDPVYKVNRCRACEAGLLTGSYHYLHAGDARSQAAVYYDALARAGGLCDELPAMIDVEAAAVREGDVLSFLVGLRSFGLDRPGIYTSRYKWKTLMRGGGDWGSSYPLWVADWGVDRTDPRLPAAWDDWQFWQWTSHGRVPGYDRDVDLDVYQGTVEEMRTFLEAGSFQEGG